jgi:predicted phage baseplate assembly protein
VALTGPVLDDRTFEQLRDELVKRIPVYTPEWKPPEWSDHNASDPGIALLELFAYLGESLLYRFNQIPDATKVAFLRLLGVQPRPAQIAHTLLALQTERPEGVQVLRGREARAGSVPFETDDEVYAWPLDTHAVGKTEAELPTGKKLAEAERRRRDNAVARLPQPQRRKASVASGRKFYEVTAVPADPLADEEPLDVSTTLDGSLWVALLAKSPAAAVAWQGSTALQDHIVFLGVAVDEEVQRPFNLVARDPKRPTLLQASELTADPPGILWHLWQPPTPGPPARGPSFTTLAMVDDSTRGLTATGVVKLLLPKDFKPLAPTVATTGDGSEPPPLDDEQLSARVIAWLRARRPATENDAIHRIRWVGINAVGASQARAAATELLGTGTGDAGQTFRLAQRPVVRGTVQLEVEEAGGWRPWTEVDTLATSGPQDRHFTVDLTAGEVRFGTRSLVPQIGQRIRVVTYRYGGGTAGNVPAGAITSLSGVAGVKVSNVLPATGGNDAASLADALEEIPAHVQRRDRAVTADDMRALALEVSGVRRAEVLPLLHPDTPDEPAAGVVSVVVFPDEDLRSPEAPLPDTALLRRVATHLNPRRLVTAELYVIPPTYRQVTVSVGVHVQEGYQVDAVRRWVELILRQYLAPVPPYGPGGSGWQLGRAVRRAELEAVAVQVEGVEYVEDELRLAVPDGAGGWSASALVELKPWEVPQLATITVVPGMPLPPGVGYQPAPTPDDPVFVPLPPEVC